MKMTPLKAMIILFIVIALAFGIYEGISMYKKKKLAEGLTDYAKTKGIVVDQDALYKDIKKLTNKEVNAVIAFAADLQDKKFVAAIGKLPAVTPILTKIHYLGVIDKIG